MCLPAQEHRRFSMLIREKVRTTYKSFILSLADSEGATAVEYAVLIALIATAIIVTVGFLGTNTRDAFDGVSPAFVAEEQKECPNGIPKDHDCGNG